MNKEWSNLNKEIKILLKDKETFKEGIEKLIYLRSMLFKQWILLNDELTIEDYAKQPFINKVGYESKTIGYSIYHVFRIEDIVLNTLIQNKQQIFIEYNYKNKMNSTVITTGNELIKEDISVFSKKINIEALWDYAKKVYEESNKWITNLKYDDLNKKYTDIDKKRLIDTKTVYESQSWLIDYWCNKDIKGLLQMPFTRHWIMHLEASIRIRNKIIKV